MLRVSGLPIWRSVLVLGKETRSLAVKQASPDGWISHISPFVDFERIVTSEPPDRPKHTWNPKPPTTEICKQRRKILTKCRDPSDRPKSLNDNSRTRTKLSKTLKRTFAIVPMILRRGSLNPKP